MNTENTQMAPTKIALRLGVEHMINIYLKITVGRVYCIK